MSTHGLFMRAVAWSLLTGVAAPGQDQMRSFRRFTSRYLIPDAGIIELRQAGHAPRPARRLHHSPPRRHDPAATVRRTAITAACECGARHARGPEEARQWWSVFAAKHGA